jgi:predicted amidophosphoribosyltransferase
MARNGPQPAGFGKCAGCAYVQSGPSSVCYRCARQAIEDVSRHRCMTCDHDLPPDEDECRNPLCRRSIDDRQWKMVWAIAMRTGRLDSAIKAHKYQGKWGWSWIFCRVLVGYFQSNPEAFREFDMIIPSPTFVAPGGYDHTGQIIEQAALEDPSWPFRRDVMTKTRATTRLAEVRGGFGARAYVAETEIGPALKVVKPFDVVGKSVLVFDDVFTGGLTLREVARKLRVAGAAEVYGIALARSRFRGR